MPSVGEMAGMRKVSKLFVLKNEGRKRRRTRRKEKVYIVIRISASEAGCCFLPPA
jgi:hypothetical protein